MIWVRVFRLPNLTVSCDRTPPATIFAVGTRRRITSTSSSFRAAPAIPALLPRRQSGMTVIMFVPIASMFSSDFFLVPSPMPSMAMTDPTPITTPSVVRAERSLLAEMARSAL